VRCIRNALFQVVRRQLPRTLCAICQGITYYDESNIFLSTVPFLTNGFSLKKMAV
jgi:hypothetical protein